MRRQTETIYNLMRISLIPLLLGGLFFLVFLSSYSGDENHDYPGGSPAGYTGSPGDGQNCVACHGGSASSVTGWITSNIPAAGYTAGNTYDITVTVSGSGDKGFEVSPQAISGAQLGILGPGVGSKLVGGTKYVTQTSSKTSNPAVWTFTWTAPPAGTGEVTFYGAFTVNKPVTKLSTLNVQENMQLSVTATAFPDQVCQGETSQLNAITSGGAGNYTYSWTSVPAGFTSTVQNPTVNPLVTTEYFVTVSDGTGSASSSVMVGVGIPPGAFAGNDTICCVQVAQVPLHGTATAYSITQWTTSGDGTFTDPVALDSYYIPGPGDKISLNVNLTLTAFPVSNPCNTPASDVRNITFDPCSGISKDPQSLQDPVLEVINVPGSGRACLVKYHGAKTVQGVLGMVNQSGKFVFSEDVTVHPLLQERTISPDGFEKGLYLILLKTGDKMISKKVLFL